LRVRKSPDETSDVVETLSAGKLVKVTEKRFQKDRVWFRIITPTGRAGWVDFNFVKLDGNA
ncbi:MAG: SH3 domain-containing protein, partial [Syntrophaceae bacterium]|nr:SH3 domain-containing protein [Syntrophaceae bacterium]